MWANTKFYRNRSNSNKPSPVSFEVCGLVWLAGKPNPGVEITLTTNEEKSQLFHVQMTVGEARHLAQQLIQCADRISGTKRV